MFVFVAVRGVAVRAEKTCGQKFLERQNPIIVIQMKQYVEGFGSWGAVCCVIPPTSLMVEHFYGRSKVVLEYFQIGKTHQTVFRHVEIRVHLSSPVKQLGVGEFSGF